MVPPAPALLTSVRVWTLDLGEHLDIAHDRVTRELTDDERRVLEN